jgi:aryl-phospho-beta-D-glucosidase BglC (GH1 family)
MAQKYGSNPHILYEVFNEPINVKWEEIKPYHEAVVKAIRNYDKSNIIILGTPIYSQDVDLAALNPVTVSHNLMYTLHYYAARFWISS